ncbi:hypothetical protein ZIOFF_015634 [Zingiber officinale]|uniref:SWIM-type domain-containing protein n=1 Tax=Zingiber officinale TaxID=94328 RepID=A0A8J5HEI3_ZINOF|nr:hypothetical protein ZIOFF_015634 [Zingiber officinale]
MVVREDDSEADICADSDGLNSLHDSDEDEVKNYPLFDPKKDFENLELKLGLVFNSKKEAKFTIESHCIRQERPVKFVKNDNIRLWAKCNDDNCCWMIHVAKMTNDNCWQIFRGRLLKLVQGSVEEQFQQITKYCAELKRSDVGATIVLKLTEDDEVPRFQRLYVCFSACKQGFKNACRRIIGVDGCFLKVEHGGQLLSAVGLDPNNNIFPICYAMVERETKDSWTWFLRLLDEDIGIGNDPHTWAFMSDKQKGLIPALESLFPDVEHRFCVRHLESNMKRDGFKSVAVKIAFWAMAKATRIEEFQVHMAELKDIDAKAYGWLVNKLESQWYAREKPIIEMFEIIRNLLMGGFQKNRERAEKWKGRICSKIRDVLEKIYVEAIRYSPMKSDEMHYQITRSDDRRDQHSVDLLSRSCSCRKYDLTGIPCKHAVCAIWCKKDDPEAYVHPYYLVETYKRCYAARIMPINGPDLWPQCDLTPPLPPVYKENVGRPAKLRRRELDEPPPSENKLRGVKKFTKCKLCGGSRHNKRTCNRTENVQHQEAVKRARQVGVNIEGNSGSISLINTVSALQQSHDCKLLLVFEIGQGTYNSVFRAGEVDTGIIVALKEAHFNNFEPESVRTRSYACEPSSLPKYQPNKEIDSKDDAAVGEGVSESLAPWMHCVTLSATHLYSLHDWFCLSYKSSVWYRDVYFLLFTSTMKDTEMYFPFTGWNENPYLSKEPH